LLESLEDEICGAFDAIEGGVNAEVIETSIAEFLASVVSAVVTTSRIHASHFLVSLIGLDAIVVDDAFFSGFLIGMEEDAEEVRTLFQDEVSATADNDARVFRGDIADDFALSEEGGILRRQFVRGVGVILSVELIEETTDELLFMFADELGSESAFSGGEVDEFRVVE
jgi:hypothetical protein